MIHLNSLHILTISLSDPTNYEFDTIFGRFYHFNDTLFPYRGELKQQRQCHYSYNRFKNYRFDTNIEHLLFLRHPFPLHS